MCVSVRSALHTLSCLECIKLPVTRFDLLPASRTQVCRTPDRLWQCVVQSRAAQAQGHGHSQ